MASTLEGRAVYYHDRLRMPAKPFGLAMLCFEVSRQYDLFYEEHFGLDEVRRFQLLAFEFADENKHLAERIDEITNQAPIGKLFGAIILQATLEDTKMIRIFFRELNVSVEYDGKEAMTIPLALSDALRGHCDRAHVLGFPRWRRHFARREEVGVEGSFVWSGDVFEISLSKGKVRLGEPTTRDWHGELKLAVDSARKHDPR